MRYHEYEERKRALEEQLHADLDLVQATLHRAVQQLLSDRKIAIESFSMGRQPTVDRKVP